MISGGVVVVVVCVPGEAGDNLPDPIGVVIVDVWEETIVGLWV